jgi:FMN phosphatase YigB (HAD superfamily)
MIRGIRAVTYDCWGTLLKDRDWEGAMELRLAALRRVLDMGSDEGHALLNEAWSKHDEAWKQVETFGPGRMAAYCLEARGVGDDDSLAVLTREFEEASMVTGVDAINGARATLETLRDTDIRRGLVCDTGFTSGRVVRRLLDDAGLIGHLEVLCFSDEVGVPKPGAEIFATALDALDARPPEAVHVGDLRRTDVAGARSFGMRSARFRGVHDDRSDGPEGDLVLDDHSALLDELGLAP